MTRRLRVAVDVRSMMDAATGIGRYTGQLVESLLDLGHRVFAYTFGGKRPSAWLARLMERGVHLESRALPMRAMRRLWLMEQGPFIEEIVGDVDVVLATETMVPRTRAPVATVVYDTLALDHPEWFNDYVKTAVPENLARAFERSRAIITISETVRARLLARAPGSDVSVVMPATTSSSDTARADGDYALFCGTMEPRKGVGVVAEALLWAAGEPELVVVGKRGWGTLPGRAALERLEALARLSERGYVSDAALTALRARAFAVVVPSKDEGFGLPLLEALAAGCPVVCSDIPVFREVAGEAALYAASDDALSWTRALERLHEDAALRASLAARALERARSFSFERQRGELAGVLQAIA